MEYIALSGVIIAGELFTKGEVIRNLTDEQAERLLKKGVIRKADAPLLSADENTPDNGVIPANEVREGTEEAEGEEQDTDDEDEGDEVEAPEIDAADAVVTEPTEGKKPARGRKKEGNAK